MTLEEITNKARALMMQAKGSSDGFNAVNSQLSVLFAQAVKEGFDVWKVHHTFMDLLKAANLTDNTQGTALRFTSNAIKNKGKFMDKQNIPRRLMRVAEICQKLEAVTAKLTSKRLSKDAEIDLNRELVTLRGEIDQYAESYGVHDEFYKDMTAVVNTALNCSNNTGYLAYL